MEKTNLYAATSLDSHLNGLSRQYGRSKVPCKTIVLAFYNQANHMFSDNYVAASVL